MTPESWDNVLQELGDWRDRALAAEARANDLERKLRGLQRQADPREKIRRSFAKGRRKELH